MVFLSGSDIFAVLPTGYGKNLCYACLPFAFELLGETKEKPIVLVVVVVPLTAIMVTYLNYTNVIHILPVCTSTSIV